MIQSAAHARSAASSARASGWRETLVATPFGQPAAEVMPVTAHGKRRGADRAAEIEGEDLRVGIAAELHGHQREKDGLARAGRTDDQRMADIADVKGKPERGASLGLAKEQGGRPEVLVPFRPRPHR